MKMSKSALLSAQNPAVADVLFVLAQNATRAVLGAETFTSITDNSTGVSASSLAAVATPATPAVALSTNLAPREPFNVAALAANNAIAVLGKYLTDEVCTPLGHTVVTQGNGVIAVAATVPACTKSLTGVDGATDVAATGTVNLTGLPTANETITINGVAITWKASGATGNQVNIGADATATALALATFLNLAPNTFGVTAVAALGVVTLTAVRKGTPGNAITLTEASGNLTVSGATLSGGVSGAMLRSEAVATINQLRNSLSTVVKAYNMIATSIGTTTLTDGIGGKASATLTLETLVQATTPVLVADITTLDLALDTEVDTALNAIANDIATVAAKIGTVLLASGTLSARVPLLLTQ